MIVTPMGPDDYGAMLEILSDQGVSLPADPQWSPDLHWVAARYAGRMEAFAALKTVEFGLLISELWCRPTWTGRKALACLVDFIEGHAQRLADERGTAVSCGGMTETHRTSQIDASLRHGYSTDGRWTIEGAQVFSKTFSPSKVLV